MTREEIIKNLIREKGMNLKAFSEDANIPYTTFYSMLDRGIGKASVDNVIKVCKALGITVEELENKANNDKVETVAAHSTNNLTDEEQEKVLEFVKFIKSQRTSED